jgi:hypothetical protein
VKAFISMSLNNPAHVGDHALGWRRSELWSEMSICAARSPMTAHGVTMLRLVIRGMIEASAMRRLSIPHP